MKALLRNAGILAAGAMLWCLLGQTESHADGAAEIRAIQLSIASAAEARNLDAIMSHYLAGEKLFAAVAVNPLYQTPEVALVNAGVCVRGTGDLVDAERYFNRALAIRPNLPEAMLELGNIAFDRGDAAQARDIVRRYLAVNPPTSETLWLGFRAERKLGDATAAAGFARRVQTEFPNSAQAQMMRSGIDR